MFVVGLIYLVGQQIVAGFADLTDQVLTTATSLPPRELLTQRDDAAVVGFGGEAHRAAQAAAFQRGRHSDGVHVLTW